MRRLLGRNFTRVVHSRLAQKALQSTDINNIFASCIKHIVLYIYLPWRIRPYSSLRAPHRRRRTTVLLTKPKASSDLRAYRACHPRRRAPLEHRTCTSSSETTRVFSVVPAWLCSQMSTGVFSLLFASMCSWIPTRVCSRISASVFSVVPAEIHVRILSTSPAPPNLLSYLRADRPSDLPAHLPAELVTEVSSSICTGRTAFWTRKFGARCYTTCHTDLAPDLCTVFRAIVLAFLSAEELVCCYLVWKSRWPACFLESSCLRTLACWL